MKKGIFNMYVKLICDGLDLSENELFSSSRKRELAKQDRCFIIYVTKDQ